MDSLETDLDAFFDVPGAPEALFPTLDLAIAVLLFLFVPFLAFEVFKIWRTGELNWRRSSGMLTSLFCLVPITAVEVLFTGALFTLFFTVYAYAPWVVPTTWSTAILCLVLVDFSYYWEHRAGHEINGFWALYHSVHHSGDHFDQTIAVRGSIFDFFITPLFYLPLVAVGFHPLLVLTAFAANLAWQQWIHTETVGRLPLLDHWLNTPSNHRVHHGRNPQYLDKNYGGVLIIWDRLFGTYAAEEEKVEFGLVKQLKSRNPLHVQFDGLARTYKALRAAPSGRAVLRILFGKPEHQVL